MTSEPLPLQRDLFDIPADVAYLNCAYLGPQPKVVTTAGLAAVLRKESPWTVTANDFFSESEYARGAFAAVLGADVEGVAIVPSVSYGVGVAAANLPIPPDRGVLLLEDEFPSDVYPWRAAVDNAGGRISTVPRPVDGDWTTGVLDRLDRRIGVVAVPHCHWADGSTVDLVAVGKQAREVGAALVVDATQSLGAWPLDLAAVQPDFLVAAAYKWLLGPYGVAYLWVAPQHRDGRPLEQNWIARARSDDFTRLIDYTNDYQPGARRYDMGERSNFILLPMSAAALEQIREWDPERVSASAGALTAYAGELARAHGLQVTGHAPHLMGMRFPGGVPAGLTDRLAAARVYVSVRGDSVRVSPNVYNTTADVDRLFEVLTG